MATMHSGDKTMALGDFLWNYTPITPWINFLRGATGQWGLINVNNMKTEEPDTEAGIIESVGSYGKQLGRITEALQAVCQRLDQAGWTDEQREAVKDFIRLAEEIDKYKNEHSPVRKGDLKAAIRGLKMKGSLDEIEAAIRDLAAIRVLKRGFDLRLMSSVNDVSGIPTVGKSLIIVATVDNVLRFRIFDGDGKVAADTDEKRLTEQARQIADFRKQLESLWPPHELTRSEKDRIIAEVTSIVGPTL